MEFEILINNLIKAIEENRACTEVKFEKNNNVVNIIHSKFSNELINFYGYLYDNNLIDRDYDEHQKKIRNKPIEEMNYSEILTMLTCIHRAERFCDGAMYDFIKNGKMLKCLVILKEIIEHRNSTVKNF